MRRSNLLHVWKTLTLVALAAACSVDTSGGFSASAGASGGSSGTSGRRPETDSVCDAMTLVEGTLCESVARCEDGAHASMACNVTLQCTWNTADSSSKHWNKASLKQPPMGCSLPCPPAYVVDLPEGCAPPNARDLLCGYPQGTCGCAPVRPSTPDGGGDDAGEQQDPQDASEQDAQDAGDQGASDAAPDAAKPSTTYVWKCMQPATGCPRERPHSGASCVVPIECDYGRKLFAEGRTMRCCRGFWTDKNEVSCGF